MICKRSWIPCCSSESTMANFAAVTKSAVAFNSARICYLYVHHVYSLFIMTKCLPTLFIYFCRGFQITIERAPIVCCSCSTRRNEQKNTTKTWEFYCALLPLSSCSATQISCHILHAWKTSRDWQCDKTRKRNAKCKPAAFHTTKVDVMKFFVQFVLFNISTIKYNSSSSRKERCVLCVTVTSNCLCLLCCLLDIWLW